MTTKHKDWCWRRGIWETFFKCWAAQQDVCFFVGISRRDHLHLYPYTSRLKPGSREYLWYLSTRSVYCGHLRLKWHFSLPVWWYEETSIRLDEYHCTTQIFPLCIKELVQKIEIRALYRKYLTSCWPKLWTKHQLISQQNCYTLDISALIQRYISKYMKNTLILLSKLLINTDCPSRKLLPLTSHQSQAKPQTSSDQPWLQILW